MKLENMIIMNQLKLHPDNSDLLDEMIELETDSSAINVSSKRPPDLNIVTKHDNMDPPLYSFIKTHSGRTLFIVETEGRRQMILDMLKDHDVRPTACDSWKANTGFTWSNASSAAINAPLSIGHSATTTA